MPSNPPTSRSFFTRWFHALMVMAAMFLLISISIEFGFMSAGLHVVDLVLSQGLAVATILLAGHDVFLAAMHEVRRRRLGASILMVVAAIGSFMILHAQEGAMAIFLFAIAERLELASVAKARGAITAMLALESDVAVVKALHGPVEVPTTDVKVGDTLIVAPGARVPLDGIIIAGKSFFDTRAITGESLPASKGPGDQVHAGCINGDGVVEITVNHEQGDTLLARVARSIEIARQNKGTTERFIERFARYYTPAVFWMALLVMIVPSLLVGDVMTWVYRGLILLVISCPCALTLSTPLAMVTAMTKLSREGILVKGSKHIEALRRVSVFAFDKTSTLTEGRLKIHDVVPASPDLQARDVLQLLASLESRSRHPLAKAIVAGASNIPLLDFSDVQEIRGRGISGTMNGTTWIAGSIEFFGERGAHVPEGVARRYLDEGKVPVLLARGDEGGMKFLGLVTVRDNLRVAAPVVIHELNKQGLDTIILSGDTPCAVDAIADSLCVEHRTAGMLPEDKLAVITSLQRSGRVVAMVGDGINDAPALAQADIGMVMGASGSDIAVDTADVTIMNDDLAKILVLMDVQRITNRIVRQNIWISIIIKMGLAVLAVIGLTSLVVAVGIGDVGLTLLVMLNGLRIFTYRPRHHVAMPDELRVDATRIACKACNLDESYPQHHGREMIRQADALVCWRALASNVPGGGCDATVPLACPSCNDTRSIT